MTPNKLTFVSFKPSNGNFVAFTPVDELISSQNDLEILLKEGAKVYDNAIRSMRILVNEIDDYRSNHKLLPARKIWQLGDAIFGLIRDLERLSLQIDSVYAHLVRDLGVKRKWLEKVIIFRRYLPDQGSVPESLNWGRCEKGTRQVAEKLQKGQSL